MNNKASLLEQIKAFFLKLFAVIVSFFHHLFHIDKKEGKKETINKEQIVNTKKETTNQITDNIAMPDDESVLSNPHNDSDEEAPNDIILELPISKIESLKSKTIGTKRFIITKKLVEELIEQAIEEIEEYKKIDFKIKKADKHTEEVIKDFKEKVIPKINHEIEKNKPQNNKELMTIVTEVVKEQNKLTPILPPKKEVKETKQVKEVKKEIPKKDNVIELDINNDKKPDLTLKVDNKKKEPYFMASIVPITSLNLKEAVPVKTETKIGKTVKEVKEEIKDKADDVPIRMVKNTPDPLRPSIKDEVKNVATVAAVTIIKAASEILTSAPKENKEKIKKATIKEVKKEEPVKEEIQELDIPELKVIEDKIKEADKPKELTKVKEELDYIDKKIEEKQEEIEEVEKPKEQEEVKEIKPQEKVKEKEFIDDSIIDEISEDISKATTKANEEIKKEDIEDKNYKDVENDLDLILKDIDDTRYKYKDTIPEVQLRKLEAQRAKIEQTKYSIDAQKKIDINNEKKHLEEIIQESEKQGLKEEIDRLNLQHRLDLNEEVIKRTNRLNTLSEKQLADIEKKIIKNRLREAFRHATITSMIALPFVRTKHFLYFTAGMMVKTFFLQIGHVLNRSNEPLSLPDINALKNGEDALNEAINVTEDNIDTLDYIVAETITKYPELKYDKEFVRYINGLQTRLNQNYNKLTRKRDIIDNTLHRSKRNIKILKKDLRKDQERMAA